LRLRQHLHLAALGSKLSIKLKKSEDIKEMTNNTNFRRLKIITFCSHQVKIDIKEAGNSPN